MTIYVIVDLRPNKPSETIELITNSTEDVNTRLEKLKQDQGQYFDEERYYVETWNI